MLSNGSLLIGWTGSESNSTALENHIGNFIRDFTAECRIEIIKKLLEQLDLYQK